MAGADSFQVALDYIALTKARVQLVVDKLPAEYKVHSYFVKVIPRLEQLEKKLRSPDLQSWKDEEFNFLNSLEPNLFEIIGRDVSVRPPLNGIDGLEPLKQVRYASLPSIIPYQLSISGIYTDTRADQKIRSGEAVSLKDFGHLTVNDDTRRKLLTEINSPEFKKKYNGVDIIPTLKDDPVDPQIVSQYIMGLTGQENPVKQKIKRTLEEVAETNLEEDAKKLEKDLSFIFEVADKYGVPRLQLYPRELTAMCSMFKYLSNGKPVKLLEVGSLAGYSIIGLAQALPPGSKLVTCEISPLHYHVTLENIRIAREKGLIPKETVIEVKYGDALDSLESIYRENNGFDFAFLDADKQAGRYVNAMDKICRQSNMALPRAIVSDNALRGGYVAQPQIFDDKAIAKGNKLIVQLMEGIPLFVLKGYKVDQQLWDISFSEDDKKTLREFKRTVQSNWKGLYKIPEEKIELASGLLEDTARALLSRDIPEYETLSYIKGEATSIPNIQTVVPLITQLWENCFKRSTLPEKEYKKQTPDAFKQDKDNLLEFLENELPKGVASMAKGSAKDKIKELKQGGGISL